MQFCDHSSSSRHCGFYSPQVSSLTTVTTGDMRELGEGETDTEEEDQYVTRDTLHAARDTCGGGHVPGPLARILERRVSTCPVLVSHLLASHYSTRYTHHTSHLIVTSIYCRHHGRTEDCSDCGQYSDSLGPGLHSVLANSNRLQWSSRLHSQVGRVFTS